MCNTKRIDWKKKHHANWFVEDFLLCTFHIQWKKCHFETIEKFTKDVNNGWHEERRNKRRESKEKENFAYFVQFKFLMKQQHDLMRRVEEFTPLFFLSLYSSKFTPSLLYFSSFSAQLERLEKKTLIKFPLIQILIFNAVTVSLCNLKCSLCPDSRLVLNNLNIFSKKISFARF